MIWKWFFCKLQITHTVSFKKKFDLTIKRSKNLYGEIIYIVVYRICGTITSMNSWWDQIYEIEKFIFTTLNLK